jgi:hypothetical protein
MQITITPRHIVITLAVLMLLAIPLGAAKYYNEQYVQNTVADSARNYSIADIRERTDWDALRAWLKQDLRKRTHNYIAQSSGFNLDDQEISDLVDFYVQPVNLPLLFYYHTQRAADTDPGSFIRSTKMISPTRMQMELNYPVKDDSAEWKKNLPPLVAEFKFKEMSWKLTKLHTPLHLLPKKAPSLTKAATKMGKANTVDK